MRNLSPYASFALHGIALLTVRSSPSRVRADACCPDTRTVHATSAASFASNHAGITSNVPFLRMNRLLIMRGGSSSATDLLDADEVHEETPPAEDEVAAIDASKLLPPRPPSTNAIPSVEKHSDHPGRVGTKRRRASDVIHALMDARISPERIAHYGDDELRESKALRRLIMERTQEQLDEIHEALDITEGRREGFEDEGTGGDMPEDADADDGTPNELRLPDPRRLLSYLAPKIPSIRSSPDASLRIQCSSESLDPGLAASILASLARVVVVRDRAISRLSDDQVDAERNPQSRRRDRRHRDRRYEKLQRYKDENMSILLSSERRFEQLVECVACGVDVKRRMDAYVRPAIDHDADAESIDDLLRNDSTSEVPTPSSSDAGYGATDVGLTARDAIRAAWGLSLLVGSQHPEETLGGVKLLDLLVALSLLVRDRLLSQMQELRNRDLSSVGDDVQGLVAVLAAELARDAAAAMWAFSCVRACTGLHFAPLFEVGCVLLCQNPFELRRRSQEEVRVDDSSVNVGASDVVDRLAKAEGEGDSGEEATCDELSDVPQREIRSASSNDTLLDFLSPNEVADVLWALALHGSRSHDSSSQEEVVLSETAATLRDLICDRLIVWLQAERDRVQQSAESDEANVLVEVPPPEFSDGELDGVQAASFESITIGGGSGDGDVQCVKVLDAAAVLEAETNQQHLSLQGPATMAEDERILKTFVKPHPSKDQLLLLFSPRDLCSIAWAVAELHDSLQISVTHVVKTIFTELGESCMHDLEGRDLSNLAWAIAKSPGAAGSSDFESSMSVVNWVAEVLVPVEEDGKYINVSKLARLQPPEIGRLVWAVATIFAQSVERQTTPLSESASRLALAALCVAKDNFSEFGTEDLSRVAWGFIELCDAEAMLSVPSFASALGKMLSMIKASLLDWESGALRSPAEESHVSRNPFSFASFFGRARFLAQLLDQRADEPQAEEGDEFSLSFLTKKSLPLLKDLPLDPSTLCKITSSFSRLRVQGGEVFARVALRLLTSRSGRLLRECPMSDLVRLCETVATQSGPLGRERVSLFVRKLVHLFNTEWASSHSYTLLSREAAVLIWSFGELGVKCVTDPGPGGASSVHRRLHLVGQLPLDDIDVQSLSTSNCVKLLIGFMSTHLALIRPDRASDVLSTLIERAAEMSGECIGLLAEAVGKLRHLAADASQETTTSATDADSSWAATNGGTVQTSEALPHTAVDKSTPDHIDDQVLIALCDRALLALADVARSKLHDMTAEEIRRVISVYTLSPFRADELVAAASRVVQARLDRLDALPPQEISMDSQLRAIGSEAGSLLKLFSVGEAPGLGATIRKGLTSFFRSQDNVETTDAGNDTPEGAEMERLRTLLGDIVSLTDRASILTVAVGSSVEDTCRTATQRSAFELGRCLDLIEHYNRIDFTTGKRVSRLVYDDKRDLAKQVLSRLLP